MWASYGNPPVVASQRAQRALITHPLPHLYPFPLTGTWGWCTTSVGASWKLVELVNQRRTRQRFHTLIWSKSHALASLHTSSLSSMCVINTSAPGFIRLHWHSNKSSDSKTLNWTTPLYILTKSGQVLCGRLTAQRLQDVIPDSLFFPICVVHLSYFAVLLNYSLGWGVRRLIVVYYSCK